MTRAGLTLSVFLALAAWAGAQGPAPAPTAADQLRMLRANRTLLDDLIRNGVRLGAADNSLKRAEACQETAHLLAVAVRRALENNDADRVAELVEHFDRVVREGLVPNLDEATRLVPADSPDAARLKVVRKSAADDLQGVQDAVATTGKASDLGDRLDGLQEKLK